MSLYKKEIEVTDLEGNKLIVNGLFERTITKSLENVAGAMVDTVKSVEINGKIINLEGSGYFYHPETGKAYEI